MTLTSVVIIATSLWVIGWLGMLALGKFMIASEKQGPHNKL